jgi:microcystin degradation protein MlrC
MPDSSDIHHAPLNRPRVLLAGLFHETHTFLEGSTRLQDFQVTRGPELLKAEGDSSPLGGILEFARSRNWKVLPTVDYRAQPGAIVEDEVIEAFWRDFLAQAEPLFIEPVDAFYFILHGAMTARSIQDVEGELLSRMRRLPSLANVPVFGVFDLHATLTPAMAELSDCLVGYRENPHTDAREAACISARLLQRCLETGERPHQKLHVTDIVWPPTGTATSKDPMKTLEAMARRMESLPGVWSVSVVAGFAFADTQFTGVSLLATGTDDPAMSSCLDELAVTTVEMKHLGNVTDPPLAEIMPLLKAGQEGLTVLVEPSDNIGGGAPGDCTGLLRALLDNQVCNSAICIADPAAVRAAEAAGKGSKVTLSIGGRGSRLDPGPVELEVEVLALNDGRFELEDRQSHLASMCGDAFDMGRCAMVRHAGITLLLTSIKTPPFDLGQWRSQGIEPTRLSVICVKAAVAHRRAYDPIAARMYWVDTPGPCSSNLKTLPYRHLRRPVYPLDS